MNKADSELSDKARCDSWTVTITTSEAAAKPLVRYFKLWCHCQHKEHRKRFLSSCVSVSPASRYGAFRVAGHASEGALRHTCSLSLPVPVLLQCRHTILSPTSSWTQTRMQTAATLDSWSAHRLVCIIYPNSSPLKSS
jgi:hypothetical protein